MVPDTYVSLLEILPDYDADGNGAYNQAEVQNAIEALGGQYSAEQKAVLWQLATGSNSSKKNPYSQAVGQQVIDAKSARKSQSDGDDESFSDAVMGQLMG